MNYFLRPPKKEFSALAFSRQPAKFKMNRLMKTTYSNFAQYIHYCFTGNTYSLLVYGKSIPAVFLCLYHWANFLLHSWRNTYPDFYLGLGIFVFPFVICQFSLKSWLTPYGERSRNYIPGDAVRTSCLLCLKIHWSNIVYHPSVKPVGPLGSQWK
jgi:hypothetical protein